MRLLALRLSTFLCRRRPGNVQYRNFSSNDAASRLSTFLCRRRPGYVQYRNFSSNDAEGGFFSSNDAEGDEPIQLEDEPIKLEDEPSIAMTLLKSLSWGDMIGAHMLTLHATDDERRMKIVEIGGAQELVNMLRDAIDYDRELLALKAIAALSDSEEAVGALHRAGAISVIKSTKPKVKSIIENLQVDEIKEYKSILLKRFQDLGYDISKKSRVSRKRRDEM